jgi:hypothetical protein
VTACCRLRFRLLACICTWNLSAILLPLLPLSVKLTVCGAPPPGKTGDYMAKSELELYATHSLTHLPDRADLPRPLLLPRRLPGAVGGAGGNAYPSRLVRRSATPLVARAPPHSAPAVALRPLLIALRRCGVVRWAPDLGAGTPSSASRPPPCSSGSGTSGASAR